jgi:hypothetical protein
MFRKETTFILGAGASWHYGYPTGEMLTKKVIDQARMLERYFASLATAFARDLPRFVNDQAPEKEMISFAWAYARDKSAKLVTRLEAVNPTLIDYFLKHNSDLADIGKLAIALVISDCEAESQRGRVNSNRRESLSRQRLREGLSAVSALDHTAFNDDWLRFVLHRLTVGIEASADLRRNKINFVTFNYDTSLEQRLFDGLHNIDLLKLQDVRDFLGAQQDRFHHVYGTVRKDFEHDAVSPNLARNTQYDRRGSQVVKALDAVYEASKGLRTVDGDDKLLEKQTLEKAYLAIERAERVFILGYGFDEFNNERLDLANLFQDAGRSREVMFTNFGGLKRVGKSASRIMLGKPFRFVPGVPVDGEGIGTTFEVSEKNVYDALEQDFESFEKDS